MFLWTERIEIMIPGIQWTWIFFPFLFYLISPLKFELSCKNAGSLTPVQLVHHLNGTYFVMMWITKQFCATNDLNVSLQSLQAVHTSKKKDFIKDNLHRKKKILGRKVKAESEKKASEYILVVKWYWESLSMTSLWPLSTTNLVPWK